MNIFKWPSHDGKKVYGKFACIIGQYMKKQIFPKFYQNGGVYSTTFGTKLSFEPKNFPILGGYIQQHVILQSVMHLKKFQTVRTWFTVKGAKMHKYRTVPTCFTAKKHTKLLPKSIAVHTHHSWKQEWDVTIVIPTMHCNVTPDVTFGGYIPQLLILNSQMKQKNFQSGGVYSTTVHHKLRNERFTLISFIGFAAILSTSQPFQICICKRKYSKWTFSNGPHMMGKRFMANLHASLDSTWKSRFSQISTRMGGVYSTTFGTKLSFEPKNFPILGGYIQQHVILQSVMHLKKFQTVRTWFTVKGAKMHKYRTVPTCFTAKKHTKLLPNQ